MAFSSADIAMLINECLTTWKAIKPRQIVLDYLANEIHELGVELADVRHLSQDTVGRLIVVMGEVKSLLRQYTGASTSCTSSRMLRVLPACLSRPKTPRDLLAEIERLQAQLHAEATIRESVAMRAQIPNLLSMLALRAVVSSERLEGALKNLAILATAPDCGRKIAESGGIALLVKVIKKGSRGCQIEAMRALGNLALSCPEHQVSIARLHGVKAIVDKLTGKRVYREQALCAVANLTGLDGRSLERVWRKVFSPLGRFTEKGISSLWKLHAVRALAGLSRREKLHGSLVDSGVIPQMLGMVDSADPVLVNLSIKALARISFKEDYCQLIRAANGIDTIVRILSIEPFRTHSAGAALCVLANLAGLEDSHDVRQWEKAVPPLIKCGESQGPACLRNSALALSSLSRSLPLQEIIHRMGGLPVLVNWLSSDDMACRERCCVCLANMSTTGNLQRLLDIDRAGGVSALVNVVQTGNAVCREQAFRVLACMSSQRPLQEVLFMRGVVGPSLSVLANVYNSHKCMLYATYTLANLCWVRECVEEVREENGEEALRRIASSRHRAASRNAMVVLNKLSTLNRSY
ncbi:unnamed protein product [Ostreobium quekettii]|uniref:Uncharacterized protein n=1 Tax=Ostreobium quekettii TaxID=121088 RepID=A0A8S1IZ59_9CHLO|nr:unnamed protein product [Ostreobium quekettii]|eukprot:evm.model.scf_778.8 EVM.evm.TU.scf_778.8   scf_778:60495-62234(-)